MHRSKRRRMDTATPTPAKPFRSPLHVDADKSRLSPSQHLNDPNLQNGHIIKATPPNLVPILTSTPFVSPRTQAIREQYVETNNTPAKVPLLTSQPLDQNRDYESASYVQLQKRHSALNLRLKQLTNALDTTNQAIKVLGSDNDAELETLITRWQAITRDAAENLFVTAKNQVDCMGGIGAWRDRYMPPRRRGHTYEQPSASWSMNDSSYYDNQGLDENTLTEDEKDQLHFRREEAKRETEKYGCFETQQEEDVEMATDDSFNIGMMLKQLNVDLDVIGYDHQNQSWLD